MADYTLSFLMKVIDGVSSPLMKIKNQFTGFNSGVSDVGRSTASLSSKFGSLGATFGRIAAPIAGAFAFKEIISQTMDMNKAMAKIATILPEDLNKVNELKKGIQSMAMDTGKSTDDLSEAMFDLVKSFKGDDVATLMERMKIAGDTATVGFTTTANAIQILNRATEAFGDTSPAAMKKVGALMQKTANASDVSFESLSSTISGLLPLSSKLGVKQEELFAIFSTFGQGEEQVGQLSNGMMQLFKLFLTNKELMQSLGVESGVALLKQKGFAGSMKFLSDAFGGSEERLSQIIPDMRTLKMVMQFSGKGMNEFTKSVKGMDSAVEESRKSLSAYKEINKTGAEWNKFTETLKVTSMEVGDLILPPFTAALTGITSMIRGVREQWVEASSFFKEVFSGSYLSSLKMEFESGSAKTQLKQFANEITGMDIFSKSKIRTEEEASRNYVASQKNVAEAMKDRIELTLKLPVDNEGNPVIDFNSNKTLRRQSVYQAQTQGIP